MSSAIESLMIGLGWLLAYEPCASRMLRSPFWTGAAHVVQLGPIRIEQRGREPAPSPSRRAEDPPRSRAREQHSRDMRVCECSHLGSPWMAASIAVLPMSEMLVHSRRLLHSTQVGPPGVLVEPTHTYVYGPMCQIRRACSALSRDSRTVRPGQTCEPRQRLIFVILFNPSSSDV
jgi:hypothetical protein